MKRSHSERVKEAGYTLVEILVAVALFVVVVSITGTLIVQANQATRRVTTSAFTQSQLLDVISRISREVAVADPITYAGPTSLETLTVRDGNSVRTQFRYDAASGKVLTRSSAAVSPAPAPTLPTMTDDPTGPSYKVIASNLASSSGLVLTYFDSANSVTADPSMVARVQIVLTAGPIAGRTSPLTITTSMATRLGMPAGFAGAGLGQPGCPVVAFTVTGNDVTLIWDPVFNVSQYLINRTPSWPSGNPYYGGVTQTGATLTDTGLTLGTTYSYVVEPVGTNCAANPTVATLPPAGPDLKGYIPPVSPPSTPALAATGTPLGVYDATLSWLPVEGATGYLLQRDNTTIRVLNGAVPPSSVVDPGLTLGLTYSYRVIAMNAAGSGVSNIVPLTPMFGGAGDTFTVAGTLSKTETGNLPWLTPCAATFTDAGGYATTATAIGSNPMAVVDPHTPNIDATIPTSTGGEAVYFRVQDCSNWLRARAREYQTLDPVYSTQYHWAQATYRYVATDWGFNAWFSDGSVCAIGPVGASDANWSSKPTTSLNYPIPGGYLTHYSASSPSGSCGSGYSSSRQTRNIVTTSGYGSTTDTGVFYWALAAAGSYDHVDNNTPPVLTQTGTALTNHYQVLLEKSVNNTVSLLAPAYTVGSLGELRVVTKGDQITIYANGSAKPLGAVTEPAFQTATKHGIGLGGIDNFTPATGIDRVDLEPVP